MKYVFFGTPRFASLVLAELLNGDLPPAIVVANPDRPAGRKKIMTPPAVKMLLNEMRGDGSAPVPELLQPEKLSEIMPRLKELSPDAFVVAAYGKIIPQKVLDIPRLGTVGVHPSLLPHYRGASPMQSAILGGETETGVALYLMDAKVDHGPILADGHLKIGSMNYLELEAASAKLGAKLLMDTLPKLAAGSIKPQVQDESQATFTDKFETDDAFVPWEDLERAVDGSDANVAAEIWRKIRAFDPEPGAWTMKGDKRIKLLRADFADGRLVLREIQRAGKNPQEIFVPLP